MALILALQIGMLSGYQYTGNLYLPVVSVFSTFVWSKEAFVVASGKHVRDMYTPLYPIFI